MTSTEDVVVVAGEPVAPVAAVPSGPLTVTVPPTAKGGDKIAVQMPDGQMMHVVVPARPGLSIPDRRDFAVFLFLIVVISNTFARF